MMLTDVLCKVLTDVLRRVLLVSWIAEVSWWRMIPGELRPVFSLALFLANLLVLAVVLYLAGLMVLSRRRGVLGDAFVISFIGSVLSMVFLMFVPYRWIAWVLCIFVWLLLIRRLFRTSWFEATVVGILAIIIFLAVTVLLALFFGIINEVFGRFIFYVMFMVL